MRAKKTAEYADSADLHSAATQSNMLSLLLAPLRTYFSLFTALALPNYLPLYSSQTFATRRAVAGEVAKSILRKRILIKSAEHLEGILVLLKVLIREGSQQPAGFPTAASRQRGGESDEAIEEQGWLARIVHFIQAADNNTQLQLLQQTRTAYEAGNERIKYTTPAIINASLKVARRLKSREHFDDDWQSQSSKLYRFMHQTITQLHTPRQSFRRRTLPPTVRVLRPSSRPMRLRRARLRVLDPSVRDLRRQHFGFEGSIPGGLHSCRCTPNDAWLWQGELRHFDHEGSVTWQQVAEETRSVSRRLPGESSLVGDRDSWSRRRRLEERKLHFRTTQSHPDIGRHKTLTLCAIALP